MFDERIVEKVHWTNGPVPQVPLVKLESKRLEMREVS